MRGNLWEKINASAGAEACWLWQGATTNGYGRVWHKGKVVRAHRLVYSLFFKLPPTLDHLCGVRNCVNPTHLEPVTQAENIRRAMPLQLYVKKAECKRGHTFTETNTYWHQGKRWCRQCRVDRKRWGRLKARQA